MTHGDQLDPGRQSWIWDRSNGYHELAKFASVAALEGLALQDRGAYEALVTALEEGGDESREAARTITGRLYEALRARKYPYAPPLGYRNRRQRIRDPIAIHRDSGTCLDLSLLFAAMCKAAGLRPFVVVLERHHQRDDHALVLVNLVSTPPGIIGQKLPSPLKRKKTTRMTSGVSAAWSLALAR